VRVGGNLLSCNPPLAGARLYWFYCEYDPNSILNSVRDPRVPGPPDFRSDSRKDYYRPRSARSPLLLKVPSASAGANARRAVRRGHNITTQRDNNTATAVCHHPLPALPRPLPNSSRKAPLHSILPSPGDFAWGVGGGAGGGLRGVQALVHVFIHYGACAKYAGRDPRGRWSL
jgi:hypothetical protein